MKKAIKQAFIDTIPVMTGYLVLGFGFGIILKSNGYSVWLSFLMSAFIYAGSMQYVAITLLTSGASLITFALTTLMVNARHLFYGVSMLEKYKNTGKIKPYLIFSLTDETYSLLCSENKKITKENKNKYFLFVSGFNQAYWVLGSVLGALTGTFLKFNTEGIDFALTALFLTVFLEQWLTSKKHTSAIIGVVSSVLCILIFGAQSFLIPTMLVIAVCLCIVTLKEEKQNA